MNIRNVVGYANSYSCPKLLGFPIFYIKFRERTKMLLELLLGHVNFQDKNTRRKAESIFKI